MWAGIACFSTAHAQTYSSEEIIISGIGFSRFTVQLEPDAAFAAHPEAARWLRIFDRNLCWSGVFRIQDSRYNACKAQGHAPDMQLLAQLVKTKGGGSHPACGRRQRRQCAALAGHDAAERRI